MWPVLNGGMTRAGVSRHARAKTQVLMPTLVAVTYGHERAAVTLAQHMDLQLAGYVRVRHAGCVTGLRLLQMCVIRAWPTCAGYSHCGAGECGPVGAAERDCWVARCASSLWCSGGHPTLLCGT